MPTPPLDPGPQDNLRSNPPGFVKDIFITFFRDFFAGAPKGAFRFDGNNVNSSEIHIADAFSIESSILEKRPAVIVQRSPMSWANIGLDNLKDLNMVTGRRIHTDMLSGTMTIHCIARYGLEAERLAWNVMFALKSLRRVLHRRGLFEVGRQGQMGAETPPGALVSGDVAAHTVDVPVYSPFQVQITWTNEPANPVVLKNLDILLNAKGPQGQLSKVSTEIKV